MTVPTLIVAGTGSGTGKTTIVCAIACALQERGYDVCLFKAGPDYLDPTFHHAALGKPGRNLDAWMTGRDGMFNTFQRGVAQTQHPCIAIVEGVMGLFDGRSPTSLEGSGAQLSQLLGSPVILIVDASGMARSAVAMLEGFANHVEDVDVCGVIFNRVGSKRHTTIIEEAMANIHTRLPITCVGGLPKTSDLFLPSRHLGLMAAQVSDATRTEEARQEWRKQLAHWAEEHLDLHALVELAQTAKIPIKPLRLLQKPSKVRIGIAMDEAFHFYYPDNLDLLREAGAELIEFSPLNDGVLPDRLDGLIIGGGYPEEFAAKLSLNHTLKKSIFEFGAANKPIYAECGGLMYLGTSITNNHGESFEMVGLLPLATAMNTKLRSLGYREVTTTKDCFLGAAGTVFRGHEFHYSDLSDDGDCEQIFAWTGRKKEGSCGYLRENILATYIHSHWGSNVEIPHTFVKHCAKKIDGHQ